MTLVPIFTLLHPKICKIMLSQVNATLKVLQAQKDGRTEDKNEWMCVMKSRDD